MIEHTKDLWTAEKGPFGEEVRSLDRNNFSTFVTNCGTNADSASKALRIVADHKAARSAPHECSDPECPGDVNRRRLDAASMMADFIATWKDCLAGTAMSQQDFNETSGLKEYNAAIAKAKE